ncbi:MAG: hypothetical protein K6B43_14645 [Treponema sp.]|nr:hypothetical protein [Treponema sp.]
MTEKQEDNLFYFCILIEFISRKTKNTRRDVISYFSKPMITRQLRLAEVNHCLSFEQVSDELIEELTIKTGNFDSVAECKYTVPTESSIGRVYQRLILSAFSDDLEQTIIDVFSSFISDEISNFNSNVYYSNPSYLLCSYQEGKLLA